MVQLFRRKSVGSVLAVILLSMAVHAHFFFTPVQINLTDNDGFLFIAFAKYISAINASLIFVIFLGLLLLQAILLNVVLVNFKMFKYKGYTIAMSYVLLSALIPQWHNLSSAFVINLFVVWLFYLLAKLHNNPSVKSLLFNIGLLTAIICLLYTPFISLVIFSLFALALLRPFNIKEWLIFIIGCLTPLYFLASYLYLTNQLHYIKDFMPAIYPNTHFPIIDKLLLIKIGYGLLIFLLGFYHLSTVRNQMLIQVRRYWNLMLIYLFFTIAIPFMFPHASINTFIICIIPLAAFTANLFAIPQRKLWFVNLLFLMFIVIIAHTNWMLIKI